MENQYSISYSPRFMDGLLRDSNFIRNEYFDNIAADRLVDKIASKIALRSISPKSYQAKAVKSDSHTYYIINVKSRMIFYRMKSETMEVAFMYHAGWNGLDATRF